MKRRIRVVVLPPVVGSGSLVSCPCCRQVILTESGSHAAATAIAREHLALHQAAPDGRLPLYPWSDGTRRPQDPTYGEHSHRVQWHVEMMQPSTVGQRAALERTITDLAARRGEALALAPLPNEAWSLPEEDA